jgi:predicted transcriptional regulator of viral defense system
LVIYNKTARATYRAPGLSSRETELIAALERDRRTLVTLDELAARFARPTAYEIVRSLVAKDVLVRLGRGVYRVRPVRSFGRRHSISAPVAAAHVLGARPYYLGGWWAWSVHGLTQQAHASRIDAFVTRWQSATRIENARLVFHRVPREKLEYGLTDVAVEGTQVRISDVERTLLDALDYPLLLGSVSEALRHFSNAVQRADVRRLVRYAARGSRTSTCQRLAVLLERRGASARALAPLLSRTRETASVLSLWPDHSRHGRVHPKWRVVENDSDGDAMIGGRSGR